MDKQTPSKSTDTIENYLKLAFAFIKSQNLEAAENIFLQIHQQQPEQIGALYGMGVINFNRDLRHEALKYFKEVTRLTPDHIPSIEYLALIAFEAEDWGEAQRYIEKLIALDPNNAEHRANLSALYKNLGQPQSATQRYQASMLLKPDYLEILKNIAQLHYKHHEFFEAEQAYKKALAIKPNFVDCLIGLGAVKHMRGDDQNAIRYSKMVLELEPRHAGARRNLNEIFADRKRVSQAEQYYLKSFALNPKQTASLNNLGMLYEAQHEYEKAKEYYQRALSINPTVVNTLIRLANVHEHAGSIEKAARVYEQVLSIEPDNVIVLNRLGDIMQDLGQYDFAESFFLRALAAEDTNIDTYLHLANLYFIKRQYLDAEEWVSRVLRKQPDNYKAYGILGNIYAAQLRSQESIQSYEKAITLKSTDTMSLLNLANLYYKQGEFPAAIKAYNRTLKVYDTIDKLSVNTIKLNQEIELCRFNLGVTQLLLGNFFEGLENYHARKSIMRSNLKLSPIIPYWNGHESLAGKTVYLSNEQGYGDYIHWLRFSEHLKAQQAKVVAICPPTLTHLFQSCQWLDGAIDEDAVLDPINSIQVLASDLPRYFEVDTTTIPATTPYLYADRYKVETLKKTLGHDKRLKIGLCWHGTLTAEYDQEKQLHLENFSRLFRDKKFQVFSLVVDDPQNEVQRFRNYVIDTRPLITDFSDTAAVIETLDLVITVDTAVAHLAGAMNKPCWILLPAVPDWRWFLQRTDSPWYPSVRLYRQSLTHPWEDVIKHVHSAANKLTRGQH